MAKLSLSGTGNVHAIAKLISDEIQIGTCDLVDEMNYNCGTEEIIVMVFEKFYARVSNYGSLTVVVSGSDNNVQVDAVSSGLRQLMVFKLDLGSENSFVESVEKILKEKGFK